MGTRADQDLRYTWERHDGDRKGSYDQISTLFAFNNSTNSRKSLLSSIRVAAVAELDYQLDAFGGCHGHIFAGASFVGVLEIRENANLLLHRDIIRVATRT